MNSTTSHQTGKARSRLQNNQPTTQGASIVTSAPHRASTKPPRSLFNKYVTYWPLLAISLLHFFLLYTAIETVDPQDWQHVLLPNTYVPMLLLITSTTFFTSSYLLLNTGRGLRIACITFSIIFLKFQNVSITIGIWIALICLFVLLELSSFAFRKKTDSKNKLK